MNSSRSMPLLSPSFILPGTSTSDSTPPGTYQSLTQRSWLTAPPPAS